MRMPWGKYKGDQIEDVPSSYLLWLLENGKTHDAFLEQLIARTLQDRINQYVSPGPSSPPPRDTDGYTYTDEPRPTPRQTSADIRTLMDQIIQMGYRYVALRAHPDVGGTHELMTQLNQARDRLRSLAK